VSDDTLTDQIREELTQVIAAVSELTGLPSNWNGQLTLVPDSDFKGKKLFSCGILIDRNLADSDLRWRTLIS
jgi:hypothetical protein